MYQTNVHELLATTQGYLETLQQAVFEGARPGDIKREHTVTRQRYLQTIGSHFAALYKSTQRELEALKQVQEADRQLVVRGETECFFCGANFRNTDHFDADIEAATKASEVEYERA